jgi:hypothetical protein
VQAIYHRNPIAQKIETSTRLPLFPPAQEILERYAEHPQRLNESRLLTVLSNQKMNGYLHEIEAICGINPDYALEK